MRSGEIRQSSHWQNRRARLEATRRTHQPEPEDPKRGATRRRIIGDTEGPRLGQPGDRTIGTAEWMRTIGKPIAPSPAKPDRCGRRGNPHDPIGGAGQQGSSGATRSRPGSLQRPGQECVGTTRRAVHRHSQMDWHCGAIRGAVAGAAQCAAWGNPSSAEGPAGGCSRTGQLARRHPQS